MGGSPMVSPSGGPNAVGRHCPGIWGGVVGSKIAGTACWWGWQRGPPEGSTGDSGTPTEKPLALADMNRDPPPGRACRRPGFRFLVYGLPRGIRFFGRVCKVEISPGRSWDEFWTPLSTCTPWIWHRSGGEVGCPGGCCGTGAPPQRRGKALPVSDMMFRLPLVPLKRARPHFLQALVPLAV